MRVISGSARGLKLKAPEGLNTRPTTDRIKESLFNILAYDLYEINFLDLFSGSGAIGIEALSRGADKAVFVDSSNESVAVIEENLKFTRLRDKAEIIKSDAMTAISKLKSKDIKFDIIFMDPPYNKEFVENTLKAIYDARLIADRGFIVAEQSIEDELPDIEGLNVFRVKEYRTTKMTFLEYAEGVK